MIEALKKLIVKHGGTYDRYDNTELDLLRALCNTLGLEYTKYMDESELFNLVAEKGIVPSGGSGGSGDNTTVNWVDLCTPTNLLPYTAATEYYYDPNGVDIYWGFSDTDYGKGVWYKNKETGVEKQICDKHWERLRYWTDSKGHTYVQGTGSGYDSPSDILYLNGLDSVLMNQGGWGVATFFESSDGYVYVGTNKEYYGFDGFFRVEVDKLVKIHDAHEGWNRFAEDNKGNVWVHVSDSYSDKATCLVRLREGEVVQIYECPKGGYLVKDPQNNVYMYSYYTASRDIYYLEEAGMTSIFTKLEEPTNVQWNELSLKNGMYLYTKSSAQPLLVYLNNGTASIIDNLGSSWRHTYTDNNGNSYCTSTTGLYCINGGTITKLHDKNIWYKYYVDSNNNLYVFGNSTNPGIFYVTPTEARIIYSDGYNYQYIFEDSKGNVYASSSTSTVLGIIHLYNGVATQVHDIGYYWQYFYEDSKGNVYISSYGTSNTGILYLHGSDEALQIYTASYRWDFFIEDDKEHTYVSSSISGTGLVFLDKDSAIQISNKNYRWRYKYYTQTGLLYCKSTTSGMLRLDGTTAIYMDVNISGDFINVHELPGGMFYITNSATPSTSSYVYYIDGDTATQYKYIDLVL